MPDLKPGAGRNGRQKRPRGSNNGCPSLGLAVAWDTISSTAYASRWHVAAPADQLAASWSVDNCRREGALVGFGYAGFDAGRRTSVREVSFPIHTRWTGSEVSYMGETLVAEARRLAGLTQQEIAERAGTSRPNVSAYEHGARAPNLRTLQRLVDAAGYRLSLEPTPRRFDRAGTYRGAWVLVPGRLPRLDLDRAFATVELPVYLDWSGRSRTYDLSDRDQRRRVYELVLREGTPDDVLAFVDGALLIDLWDELALPDAVRTAWHRLVDAELDEPAE